METADQRTAIDGCVARAASLENDRVLRRERLFVHRPLGEPRNGVAQRLRRGGSGCDDQARRADRARHGNRDGGLRRRRANRRDPRHPPRRIARQAAVDHRGRVRRIGNEPTLRRADGIQRLHDGANARERSPLDVRRERFHHRALHREATLEAPHRDEAERIDVIASRRLQEVHDVPPGERTIPRERGGLRTQPWRTATHRSARRGNPVRLTDRELTTAWLRGVVDHAVDQRDVSDGQRFGKLRQSARGSRQRRGRRVVGIALERPLQNRVGEQMARRVGKHPIREREVDQTKRTAETKAESLQVVLGDGVSDRDRFGRRGQRLLEPSGELGAGAHLSRDLGRHWHAARSARRDRPGHGDGERGDQNANGGGARRADHDDNLMRRKLPSRVLGGGSIRSTLHAANSSPGPAEIVDRDTFSYTTRRPECRKQNAAIPRVR